MSQRVGLDSFFLRHLRTMGFSSNDTFWSWIYKKNYQKYFTRNINGDFWKCDITRIISGEILQITIKSNKTENILKDSPTYRFVDGNIIH